MTKRSIHFKAGDIKPNSDGMYDNGAVSMMMLQTSPTFGLTFSEIDSSPEPVVGASMDVIGIIGPCSTADPGTFPLNQPVLVFSNDTVTLGKLGQTVDGLWEADGFIADAINGINAQLADYQIAAQLVIVITPYGTSEVSEALKLQQTIANIMGQSVTGTGLYAFLAAPNTIYCTPRIIIAPGYTGQMANSLDTLTVGTVGVGYIPGATYQVTFAAGEGEQNLATLVLPTAQAIAAPDGTIDDAEVFIDTWGAWFPVAPTATLPPPQTTASGSINFSGQPTAGNTITIGTQALTFIAHGATPSTHQVALGTTLSTTIDAILAYLATQEGDPQLGQCTYAYVGPSGTETGVTVTAVAAGNAMNSFNLATNDPDGSVISMSGGSSSSALPALPASGQIMFEAQPGIGSSITFNSQPVTFIANGGSPAAHQVALGLNLLQTINALQAYLMGTTAQADANLGLCTYTVVESALISLNLTTKATGSAANGFTLTTNVTGATTAPFLSGGQNAQTATTATLLTTMALGANPVCANMTGVLDSMIAHAIVESAGTSMIDDGNWRDTLNSERLIPISGGCKIIDPISGDIIVMPRAGRSAGLMLAEDFKTGYPFHSFANEPVQGIVGPSRAIDFSLTDGATEGQLLLSENIGIMVRGLIGVETAISSGGFVEICTDNAGDDPLWQMYNVKRGSDYINLSLMPALRVYLGRQNITKQTIVNILATINDFLSDLQAQGQILGFTTNFQGSLNTSDQIRLGRLTVGYAAEPAPVLKLITTQYARYAPAIDAMVSQLSSQLNLVVLAGTTIAGGWLAHAIASSGALASLVS